MSQSSSTSGFMVLHSNRMEQLVDLLAEFVVRYPLPPLVPETALIQSLGMADWLNLQLAQHPQLGISASLEGKMPATFLWHLYRLVLGEEKVPLHSPFEKERLQWRFYQLLPQCTDPVFAPLQQFLEGEGELKARKRLQLAKQLADLFDAYQMYRADWLKDWAAKEDILRLAYNQEQSLPVPEEQAWQPALWRALLDSMAPQERDLSRALIHEEAMAKLQEGHWVGALPPRVLVFGVSALPQQVLEALAILSQHSQVVLFVHNPCQHYWADLVEDKHLLQQELTARKRHRPLEGTGDLFEPHTQRTHPLLAAWGKQGRDFIGLLYRHDHPESYQHLFENSQVDVFSPLQPSTVLAHIQQDILDLIPPSDTPRTLKTEDNSLRFAITHGIQRELEVLQDHLLHLFNQDETLAPRQVVVMVPQIEQYAPYIEAVFGGINREDPRYLPFTIGDRSLGATSSMAQGLEIVLALPHSRFTSAEVLDLLNVPALQRRFNLTPADVTLIERWVQGAGVRWGLDAQQRSALGVPGFDENTWLFGLRRMLAGYLVGGSTLWQGIAPYDEVAGLDARLAGELAHLLAQLQRYWQLLQQEHSAQTWEAVLASLLDAFFLPEDNQELTLSARLREQLRLWCQACEDAGLREPMPLVAARTPFDEVLSAEGPTQRFLVGSINFCTLMPMRSIPFEHVCLLGMNDGEYPRPQDPLSFDLMHMNAHGHRLYRPGDRSRRDDDRFLFLEALLSARQSLYVSWVGRSQQDNTELPPSVLVGQLRDTIDAYWGKGTSEKLTVEHAVQPFSERYFIKTHEQALPPTYAKQWFALHETTAQAPQEVSLPPLDWPDTWDITVEQLNGLLRQPVRFFFRERLGVDLSIAAQAVEETEPFSVDALENWQLQNTLLETALAATPETLQEVLAQQVAWLKGTGSLPVGETAELILGPTVANVEEVAQRFFHEMRQWQRQADMPLHVVVQGVTVQGHLNHLYGHQGHYKRSRVITGKLKERWDKLIQDWLLHVLACAQGTALTTHIYGSDAQATLPPLSQEQAQQHLATLLEAYQTALAQPLPVACKVAFLWLKECHKHLTKHDEETAHEKALAAAKQHYEREATAYTSAGERASEPALARTWPTFESMYEMTLGFEHWSTVLYGPLFEQWEFLKP